jgi:uncharacterized protein YdeI (BOF family)
MSRNFLVTAVAAVSLVAFSASGFTEEAIKGSKSDTSDRMGGGGGAKGAGGAAKTTTVKRSKSNTSDPHGRRWRSQWWVGPRRGDQFE